jgi:hypothetical protein
MAHSDYIPRGLGLPFCPTARLASAVGALDTTATMTGYVSPIAEGIRIGMAAMIEDEIVVVTARAGNVLTLGRGTCDTVPAPHPSNATIFFFDDSVGSDDRQYVATESVGIKPLPRTNSGAPVAVEASPPEGITFNWRFHRPYPPGLVRVNGSPFTSVTDLSLAAPNLVLTWTHRDRIVQQDQLLDHAQASVGPEAGTTYRVGVYRTSDNALLRSVDIGLVATWTYTRATAIADFGLSGVDIPGYVTLESRRDGLSSWQRYRIDFVAKASILGGNGTLDVGYLISGATTAFATLPAAYSVTGAQAALLGTNYAVGASGSAAVSAGYEVASAAPSLVEIVNLQFNGTNGQTTGIANTGTLGGNAVMTAGARLTTSLAQSGSASAIFDATDAAATLNPTNYGPLGTGFTVELEFYVRIDSGTVDSQFDVAVGFVQSDFAVTGYASGTLSVGIPGGAGGLVGTYAFDTWHKILAVFEESTSSVDLFVNDVLVLSNQSVPSSLDGYIFDEVFARQTIGEPGDTTYIDNLRVRAPSI